MSVVVRTDKLGEVNFLNPQQPYPLRQQVASQRALNTVYTNGSRRRLVLVTLHLQTPASGDIAVATFQAPAQDLITGYQSYLRIEGWRVKTSTP
jgi:hypothetical protein